VLCIRTPIASFKEKDSQKSKQANSVQFNGFSQDLHGALIDPIQLRNFMAILNRFCHAVTGE
jgi:hypothetical protein